MTVLQQNTQPHARDRMVLGYKKKKKRVVFGFRPSFVPLSLWACQVDGESVGLAAYG